MSTTANAVPILILGYLYRYCRGAAAARTQSRIAGDLRHLGVDVRPRDVRDALAVLVDAGAPIGTVCGTPPGAFVCENRVDFLKAYRNLAVRFFAPARRARAFKVLAREPLSGQKKFDFAEARERFADLEEAPLLTTIGKDTGQ